MGAFVPCHLAIRHRLIQEELVEERGAAVQCWRIIKNRGRAVGRELWMFAKRSNDDTWKHTWKRAAPLSTWSFIIILWRSLPPLPVEIHQPWQIPAGLLTPILGITFWIAIGPLSLSSTATLNLLISLKSQTWAFKWCVHLSATAALLLETVERRGT